MSHRRIRVFDTTLRDGEQSPGIALQPDEKVEVALQLERLRVDVVEAGFAGASPGDFEGVRAVSGALASPTVASFALASVPLSFGATESSDTHPTSTITIPIERSFILRGSKPERRTSSARLLLLRDRRRARVRDDLRVASDTVIE